MDKEAFSSSINCLRIASEKSGINHKVVELLCKPKRIFEFTFPIRMDDNTVRIFTGYRVHWSDALGTIRDGVRFSKTVNIDELKTLALLMTIKHGVGGIPAGGGKGGVVVNPFELSNWELEKISRGYIRALPLKGAWVDVPGVDMGTNEQTQGWMLDEYESIVGYHSPAAINDKPSSLGGALGSSKATGLGMFYIIEHMFNSGLIKKDSSFAIQGYGTVGSALARLLFENGFKVSAISDVDGGIYAREGIPCDSLDQHVRGKGSIHNFPCTTNITNDQLINLDIDILVLAAVQNVINKSNAATVKASIIIEGANGPVTYEAEQYLLDQKKIIIPDVVANVGSAIVCHFERIQGLTEDYWSLSRVEKQLKKWILKAYNQMELTSEDMKSSYRIAAWVTALKRIEESILKRGWI